MSIAALLAVLAVVAPLSPLRVVHAFVSVGRYAAGDRGVDLAGVPGQVVVSATAGTVSFAGPVAGQGVVTVRLTDGRRLTSEPVAPPAVRVGEQVVAGTPLGRLAGTHPDCPAPACLHWGLVDASGRYADPLALLRPPRVRLLPLGAPDEAAAVEVAAGAVGSAAPAVDDRGGSVPTRSPAPPRATSADGGAGATSTQADHRQAAGVAASLPARVGGASLAAGALAFAGRRLGGVARRRGRNLGSSRRGGAQSRQPRRGSLRRPP